MAEQSHYADLEIRILNQDANGYPVELTLDNSQEFPRGYLPPDFLQTWQPGGDPVADGERLFGWFLTDDGLKTAWSEVRGRHAQRRLRLRIDADAPALHALPWELLREPVEGSPAQTLAAVTATPFSRYFAARRPPGQPIRQRPLRMLVAIANPDNLAEFGLQAVEVAQEWTLLQQATQGLAVELALLPQPCTLAALEAELKRGYHILHIISHGRYSERSREAALFLADAENQVALVKDVEFAEMLNRQLPLTSLQQDGLRLVFLASCQSATRSPADALRGFAPRLVEAGVPAVLAMQDLVPVVTARQFAQVFYRQLLQHGLVDLAANEARSALLTAKLSGAAIPVLFSRLRDNQLLAPTLGGERKPFEPETIFIPAGSFLMGDQPGEGAPAAEKSPYAVTLPAYSIGKTPVTNRQYAEFLKQNPKQEAPPKAGWFNRQPPKDKLDHPVVSVSWHDARAYCAWLSQAAKRPYRLPTEAEWEKAARGSEGQRYPWGNEWVDGCCNVASAGTTAVDKFPAGASPYGCLDLLGNVQEWTNTLWGADLNQSDFPYHYAANDGREEAGAHLVRAYRIHRGGSFKSAATDVRCSARAASAADSAILWRGFRVVLEVA